MWFCYKFSSLIWYREFYMEEILQKITSKKLFFLHNAIELPENTISSILNPLKKDIDFLWLNRVIRERKSDWFIAALKKEELKNTNNYLIGMVDKTFHMPEQEFVQNNKPANVTIMDYISDPGTYYQRAKFFVLPADVVFANNGFIFNHNEQAFQETILKVIDLNEADYNRLSLAARKKIEIDFSPQKYTDGLKAMYDLL